MAREITGNARNSGTIPLVGDANMMGCGDPHNDGVDEFIFEVAGKNNARGQNGILVVSLSGKQRVYKSVTNFVRGLVVRRVGADLPLVATISGMSSGRRAIRLVGAAGGFSYPTVYLPQGVSLAAGVFVQPGAAAQPAMFWASPSRMVTRQYLVSGSTPQDLFSIPKDLKLVRSQNFSRTAEFRN